MAEATKEPEFAGAVLRVSKIGNSIGVILPKDLLARLDLKEGDKLHAIECAEHGLKLTPYDPGAVSS